MKRTALELYQEVRTEKAKFQELPVSYLKAFVLHERLESQKPCWTRKKYLPPTIIVKARTELKNRGYKIIGLRILKPEE